MRVDTAIRHSALVPPIHALAGILANTRICVSGEALAPMPIAAGGTKYGRGAKASHEIKPPAYSNTARRSFLLIRPQSKINAARSSSAA